jgi:glycine cleavage system protein P-like pyridoxal-binding family
MAGLKVVPVKVHSDGNLDLEDLSAKAEKHKDNLAAFMVQFPDSSVPLYTNYILRSRIPQRLVSLSLAYRM